MECFGTTDFYDNSRLITLSAIIISGLHCIYIYFSAEEKFMTQVTMDHLKVTSSKLFVVGNQVQFLHLLSFLIKSLTFIYYIGYLKTIL